MRLWKTALLTASVAALAACGGSESTSSPGPIAGPGPTPSPTPTPTPSLVFAEEFNDGALDRSLWNVEGPSFWVNNELQAYVDSADTIGFGTPVGADGGALVLKPVSSPGFVTPTGRHTDFLSGRINTRDNFDVTYGRVTARIRMPDTAGVWPAFWLLGYGQWPDAGETDIMEYVGVAGWTSVAMHGPGYSGNTPLSARQDFPAGTDVTDWHEYSVDRKEDELIFFVDDREIYRVTRAQVEAHGPWRFDRPQYVILNFALGGNYPNAVNGITAPYYGMPQETADKIARGEVAMEVDWVRVWSSP